MKDGWRRSWLFVPSNKSRYLEKLAELTADVAVLDLEDGVPLAGKAAARGQLSQFLESGQRNGWTYVRVNQIDSEWFKDDIDSAVRPSTDGIVIPKVSVIETVHLVDAAITAAEASAGLMPGSVRLILAIETATGLLHASELASASRRVEGLMLGAEDLALDLGLLPRRDEEARDLIYARSSLVTQARSAKVLAIDGVYPDYSDERGLEADALQARRLGFDAKTLFHPSQIELINARFMPTIAELDYARRIIFAFQEAEERGDGCVALGGQLIDLPIVKRAESLLVMSKQT